LFGHNRQQPDILLVFLLVSDLAPAADTSNEQ